VVPLPPIVRFARSGTVPLWLKVVVPVTVRLVTPDMVPELVAVVTAEIVRFALLGAEIVPALVRVVILERVAIAGKVIVDAELFVSVVGLNVRVPVSGKLMMPELVMVPPVTVIGEVDWKLMVLPELLRMPVLVRVVRAGKLRVI
jgi:hypothetical protein